MHKARETVDFGLNAQAESALAHARQLAPEDVEALKLQALAW